MVYLFDRYSLDVARRELRRDGAAIPVEPQVFDLLLYLLRHRDRVVTRDDLLAHVWRGRIVSESTLSSRVTFLRQAVGDTGKTQRLIRTVARNGVRFVGEVRERPDAAPLETPAAALAEAAAERRQVSVLACRLGGIASLAGRLDPEALRDVLAASLARIRTVISKADGFVAHTTGEDLVAYFGYPRAHEDDAERALGSALAITAPPPGSTAANVRAAVATGLVVVSEGDGAAGTAVGTAPYAATRLLDAATEGRVAICTTTRALTGNLFECRQLSDDAWEVLGEGGRAGRFEALRPPRSLLIGRDEELALLARRWRQAAAGDGRVVFICGEPGIGKSHLVAAFRDTLGPEGAAVARFDCSPHRQDTALHPVISHMREALKLAMGDDRKVGIGDLERFLAREGLSDLRDVTLFSDLLGIAPTDERASLALSAPLRKELLLDRTCAYLAGLAQRAPLLVVVEDAHWIDPTTRELFDAVIATCGALRMLFVMTYRPEFAAPWIGQAHVTALRLNRLGREDNASIIQRVAGGKSLPGPLVELILAQTDGVPLFVEEVTKSVLESGLVREGGDGYVLADANPVLAVPQTLQASLVARLDRLGPARLLAQTCAALGREFGYGVARAVASIPGQEFDAQLSLIVAAELVHQRGTPPQASYLFKHALVQEAAYETMLKVQRTKLHERIADVLASEFPDVVSQHPDVLAYHCREAGLWERAIDYTLLAARMSLERSAGVEAQAHVERAVAMLPNIAAGVARRSREGRCCVTLADALIMTQGFASPSVKDTLAKARELVDEAAYPVDAVRALGGLFNYHLIRSESPLCLAIAEPLLERAPKGVASSVAHYFVGAAHLHLGHYETSIRSLEEARSRYDEEACRPFAFVAAGTHLRSFTLIWLGLAYLYKGAFSQAAATISDAVADARRRLHPFTLVSALLAQARFLNQVGDLHGAIGATEEGLEIARRQRSPYHLSRANVLRAINVVDSGRPEEGIELMEQALAAHRMTGANFQSSYNLTRLAHAHALAGRAGRALELADAAIAEVERTGERWWESEAVRWRGEILLLHSPRQRAEAQQCFEDALACSRRQGATLWELLASNSLACLWRLQGRADEASALMAQVGATLDDAVDERLLARTRAVFARL